MKFISPIKCVIHYTQLFFKMAKSSPRKEWKLFEWKTQRQFWIGPDQSWQAGIYIGEVAIVMSYWHRNIIWLLRHSHDARKNIWHHHTSLYDVLITKLTALKKVLFNEKSTFRKPTSASSRSSFLATKQSLCETIQNLLLHLTKHRAIIKCFARHKNIPCP